MSNDLQQTYSDLMKGYQPSDYVNKEWPMKDGMYQQYSAFDSDIQCSSGTHTSIIML